MKLGTEVCDSHTTIRPRELPQCFQSRLNSQDKLYKELHPVTRYICRVLSALSLLRASSAFVNLLLCMIQNKRSRGHRREVLHVRRNHGITAIVILRRIGRPLGEIFIFLLLKNTALLPVSVECTRFRWCSFQHLSIDISSIKVILLPPSGMGYDQSHIILGSALCYTPSIQARKSNNI